MKKCTRCLANRRLSSFGPDTRRTDGLGSWCNRCIVGRAKERRDSDTPEQRAARNIKLAAYAKRYRLAHPEKSKAARNAAQARYREKYPERIRARGYVAWYLKEKVLDVCGRSCLCCGSSDGITIDHVKPLGEGESRSLSNLQVLCRSCNARKGTKVVDYRTDEHRARLA